MKIKRTYIIGETRHNEFKKIIDWNQKLNNPYIV